jgi:hypothetical protein
VHLSKLDSKTDKIVSLLEISLKPERDNPKTFLSNPIGIKDTESTWSPAEPYAFPLISATKKDSLLAVSGIQKAIVSISSSCNFLKMGLWDGEKKTLNKPTNPG